MGNKKRDEGKPREREPVDGEMAVGVPDYEAESATVADDLREMLDRYTAEDVAFALLRPRSEGKV